MPFLPKLIKIYKNLRKFYEKFTKNCCKNRSKFRKNVNIDIQTPIPNPRQSRHPYLPPMKTHRRYRKFTKNWHKIYENFLKLFAKFYKIFENRWIFVKIGQNRQKWVSKPLRGPPRTSRNPLTDASFSYGSASYTTNDRSEPSKTRFLTILIDFCKFLTILINFTKNFDLKIIKNWHFG